MKKESLIKLVWYYLRNSKEYPHKLYNLYGSEGDSTTRFRVNKMIEVNGFWITLYNLVKKHNERTM